MTALLEDPTPIIVLGVLAEAILAGFLFTTRRGVLLWPMAGVLGLVVLGVVVGWLVETEVERVEKALYAAAAAVEQNDQKRAADFIARSASDTLQRAVYYMNRVQFSRVKLRGMKVTINELTSPPTAEARFFGTAQFKDRVGEYPYNTYAADFLVDLVQEDGTWKVEDIQGDPLKPLGSGGQ